MKDIVGNLTIEKTCNACPEQYDVFKGSEIVGYMRLRSGWFSVQCPDVGGEIVYEAEPEGDGSFDDCERDFYLREAVAAINNWLNKTNETSM